MATDLVFSSAPLVGSPVDLVFGETDAAVVPPASLTVQGSFPELTFTARLRDIRTIALTGAFPPLLFVADMRYASSTARPTVELVAPPWQVAAHGESGVSAAMQPARALPAGAQTDWEPAAPVSARKSVAHNEAQRYSEFLKAVFQGAARLGTAPVTWQHQDADRALRQSLATGFQQGAPAHADRIHSLFQDGLRNRRTALQQFWQVARRHVPVSSTSAAGPATWLNLGWQALFQESMRPPAGMYVVPTDPVFEPCYLPDTNLVFEALASNDLNLVFVCERHDPGPEPGETIVVPVRRIYMIFNTASLRRIDGDIALPVKNMNMTLDAESWTWGFTASLPGYALADLEPSSDGVPVVVEAMLNGVAYRFIIENMGRDRAFGKNDLKIQGRGKSALLDEPYAPTLNFGNTIARTAQQLMGDVLQLNGVPLDWAVDWTLDDWLVPAGVFSHQGSYIAALNAIAGAAGGYLQPHASLQSLAVLPRYPLAPWLWNTVTPDYELPSDVTTQEGIEWVERPRYNRVFVSGQQAGVLGQVTRTGTAGDLVAPMVTDALITTASAARQRGISVLGNTGRQALVSLRLPVLAETGVIPPGKFVRYLDGSTVRLGLTRGVSIDSKLPEIWQTIGVETHV